MCCCLFYGLKNGNSWLLFLHFLFLLFPYPKSFGWILILWLDLGWFMAGFWLNFGWILTGLWLKFYRSLAGIWLDFGWILTKFQLDFGWISTKFWLGNGLILACFWLDFGWTLAESLLDFGWIWVRRGNGEISPKCESIGHHPFWGRCPKGEVGNSSYVWKHRLWILLGLLSKNLGTLMALKQNI